VDALPPPPQPATYVYAPSDIYPRGSREEELCSQARHPDWVYLGALAALDAGAFWWGSTGTFKYADGVGVRMMGPAMIGLTWGATLGGVWLALPQCRPHWVGSPPREGDVRASWPLALSLALLAGATAPIVNGIAVGYCTDVDSVGRPLCQSGLPASWTTFEREMHLVVAGVAGFGGALLPYLIPPRTWSAAREIERMRFGADGRGNMYVGYSVVF
jgi:hypothetical protein